MRLGKTGALVFIAWSLGIGTLHAQTLGDTAQPVELPPEGFTGRQFVDSSGCVFIRAGIGGDTSWVPRVTRDRQQICGQTPTFEQAEADASEQALVFENGASVQAESAPAVNGDVAEAVTGTSGATVDARAPVAADQSETVATAEAQTGETVFTTQDAELAEATAPARTERVKPTRQERRIATEAPTPREVRPKRVKRQVPRMAGPKRMRVAKPAAPIDRSERVMPKHVYEEAIKRRGIKVPKGYRLVWEDDRLNPRRAEMSRNGIAQSRLVWTNTVPRRLVDTVSGRDVTAKMPLVYPYTDTATQTREYGKVTIVRKEGKTYKYVTRNAARAEPKVAPKPRVSTRSAPKAKPKVKAAPARVAKATTSAAGPKHYIQVGAFGVPENAQRAVSRLRQAGLPVRVQVSNRAQLKVVLAGPFGAGSELSQALRAAQAQGFKDAFVR